MGERTGIGLRGKALTAVAAIFVVTAGVGAAVISATADDLLDHLGASFVRKSALLHQERILSPIRRELALSLKLADSPVIQQWMANEEDPELRRQAMAELRSHGKSFQEGAYFIAVGASRHYYFDDAAGTYAGRELIETLDPADPEDAWFFTALAMPAAFSLNVDENAALGVTKVWINVAVGHGSQRLGITGTGLDLTGFINDFVASTERGVSAIILDGSGRIQAHQNPQLIDRGQQGANPSTVFELLDPGDGAAALRDRMARLNGEGSAVEVLPLRIQGREQLAAIARMPEMNWYVLTLVDVAQVFDLWRFLPHLAVLLGAAALVVAAVGALLERIVLTPLVRLTRGAEAVARGSHLEIPATRRRDEIGQLTRAFRHMAATVRAHTQDLERNVQERTEALHRTNAKLEETNRQLLESIECARRIQSSILPRLEGIEGVAESFVVWRPRDAVGGDLYLARRTRGGFLVGVIDCVGHGVPGAVMTTMAHALFDAAIAQSEEPGEVLALVDRRLRAVAASDREGGSGLGLDAALCLCKPAARRLVFAGARLSLHLCEGSNVVEIKGERRSLGDPRHAPGKPFAQSVITLAAGQTFCLATDGLLDQAGGPRGFGFGTRRFHHLLGGCSERSLPEMQERLLAALHAHQGARPQRDDVTVVGFRPALATADAASGPAGAIAEPERRDLALPAG